MTTAIRTLAVIALAAAVPLIALWLWTQRIFATHSCSELGCLYVVAASIPYILAVLLLVALSAVLGIITALIRQHWGWAGVIVVCVLATIGFFAAILSFKSAVDPFNGAFFPWVWVTLPLVCCPVLLAYTFSADLALDARRQDRSQRNTLLTLAILAIVFTALYWLAAFLTFNLNVGNLGDLLLTPQILWFLTISAIGTATTALYAWACRQLAWSLVLGALSLGLVVAIAILTPQGKALTTCTCDVADSQAPLLAAVAFLLTIAPPVASLIYLVIGRRFASAMDVTPTPIATPA